MIKLEDRKILLTGSRGRLGKEIFKLLPNSMCPSRSELDLTDHKRVLDYVHSKRPNTIIHCAAETNAVACETNKSLAWDINVNGTKNLIDTLGGLEDIAIDFIHVSTASVLQETKLPDEKSILYPRNFYNFTKYVAEKVVEEGYKDLLGRWLIARVMFVDKGRWPHTGAFTDRWSNYLYAQDVAHIVVELLDSKTEGIIHISGDKIYSMYEIARMEDPDVKPISLRDYRGPVYLPSDMTFTSKRIGLYKLGFSYKEEK